MLTNPVVARRSCEECQRFVFDDSPQRMGLPMLRAGQRVERLPGGKTPCGWCPKLPPDVEPIPANALELSDRNRQAYEHYRRCRAVIRFPDDSIVAEHARLIRDIEDRVAEERQASSLNGLLKTVFKAG